MKRKIQKLFLALTIAAMLMQTSCIGPFRLTNNLYNWNNQVGDKWVNTLIFAAFVIVPVYGVTLFLDGIIFNSIEFWGGTSPISMEEGETEEQIITQNGVTYKITAVKNKFITEQLEGPNKGEVAEFEFIPEESCWYLNYKGEHHKLVHLDEETGRATAFFPNGEEYLPEVCLK